MDHDYRPLIQKLKDELLELRAMLNETTPRGLAIEICAHCLEPKECWIIDALLATDQELLGFPVLLKRSLKVCIECASRAAADGSLELESRRVLP